MKWANSSIISEFCSLVNRSNSILGNFTRIEKGAGFNRVVKHLHYTRNYRGCDNQKVSKYLVIAKAFLIFERSNCFWLSVSQQKRFRRVMWISAGKFSSTEQKNS